MKEEAALGNEPLRYPASTSGLMGVLQGQELPLPSQHYPRALRKAVVLSVFPSGFITKLPISTCQMLLAEANRHEHQHWQWSFFRKIWPLFSYQPKAKRLSNSRSSCSSPWPRHVFSDLPLSSSASYSAIPFCLPSSAFAWWSPSCPPSSFWVMLASHSNPSAPPLSPACAPPHPTSSSVVCCFSMALICLHTLSCPISLSHGVTTSAVLSPSLLVWTVMLHVHA